MIKPAWNLVEPALISSNVTQFYSDPTQERCSSVLISTLTLSVAIVTLLLIPLDIYNVSREGASESSIQSHGAAIQLVYYGLFLILLGCVFVVVPFVLFYHEVRHPQTVVLAFSLDTVLAVESTP